MDTGASLTAINNHVRDKVLIRWACETIPQVPQRGSWPPRLNALRDQAAGCRGCRLAETRRNVVFGSGSADAEIVMVGEAPGAEEDASGGPFKGRSGQLLDLLLADAGLSRDGLYITNLVKCRPPGNRNPRVDEIDACQGWLAAEIDIVRPQLICTFGNPATQRIRGDRIGIMKVRGVAERRSVHGWECLLLPLVHPAAALRSRELRTLLAADIANIPGLVEPG